MSTLTKHTAVELAANIGKEITIWPLVGRGESRDTEPGLQPWKATLVGVTQIDGLLYGVILNEEAGCFTGPTRNIKVEAIHL